uniref:Uncharacterized protein n=1 Tax=Anguilla anguilla TaxID=7936 RepID=A0A0E9UJL6_ANGAN
MVHFCPSNNATIHVFAMCCHKVIRLYLIAVQAR